MFAKSLVESKIFIDVKDSKTIIAFLDNRKKDSEQKQITTWNDYLWRLKMFYRWLYNVKLKGNNNQRNYYNICNWKTPDFVTINKKKTKQTRIPFYFLLSRLCTCQFEIWYVTFKN